MMCDMCIVRHFDSWIRVKTHEIGMAPAGCICMCGCSDTSRGYVRVCRICVTLVGYYSIAPSDLLCMCIGFEAQEVQLGLPRMVKIPH